MKRGTQNFYENELDKMQEHPDAKAMEIGRKPPYHLQFSRKINQSKNEVKNED